MKIDVSDYYKNKVKDAYVVINKEPRRMCVMIYYDGSRHVMSYAKYLYTSHYKCDVPKGEEIDHINGNKLDDRIENLQKISKNYNIRKDHNHKEMVLRTCPVCGTEFLFEKRNLKKHPNPCCSRSCGGKKSIMTAKENCKGHLSSKASIQGELKDKIIELRKQGLSSYKIAEQIPNISRSTISRFLTANNL